MLSLVEVPTYEEGNDVYKKYTYTIHIDIHIVVLCRVYVMGEVTKDDSTIDVNIITLESAIEAKVLVTIDEATD
mgnify:FL=1